MRSGEEYLDYWLVELDEPSFVYVVQGRPESPIKIGVAKDPRARLKGLQTGNPDTLHLLHVVPGDFVLEAEFHYRLRDSSVRGEWFAEPGIDGFLVWIEDYAQEVRDHFERHGELPEPPLTRKKAFEVGKRTGANILHRWRMSQPSEAPVSVRYTKPEPLSPEEVKARMLQRERERV